ncbi:putative fibroblast growth factor 1 [Hydra vulgaris]|uniref:putative fibroblast growth factor 1 n=1 Tax=Hydra vulgaris TaxID=6087 RepID=UPI0006416428|nr:putative fibroblast growth factor 1 [Hydra vulgaris]
MNRELIKGVIIYMNLIFLGSASKPLLTIEKIEESINKEWMTAQKSNWQQSKQSKPILVNKGISYSLNQWTNCRVIYARCRNGLDLAVVNRKVVGINSPYSINGIFEIQSYGTSVVMLKHAETNKYLAMDKKGNIQIMATKSDETLFYHYLEENGYITFASVKYYINEYYDLFLSLRKNGKIRKANRTAAGQSASQFLLIPTNTSRSCVRK